MKRIFIKKLIEWKDKKKHKPIILRGARQVGKTWIVKYFGNKYFKNRFHIVDFEKHPDWHIIFEKNLDVKRIILELELLLNVSIDTKKDLLFFDEIQNCPRAIMSLRYFYEELPTLHLISTGSLLEFAIKKIPFPVGRVQIMTMYPMTFLEYLLAINKKKMVDILLGNTLKLSETIHQLILEELRLYLFIGGMPECVKTYKETHKLKNISEIQAGLIETFKADFSKYTPHVDHRCIKNVLNNVSKSVGNQIKYTKLTDSFSMPTNKKAFDLLNMARIVYKISSVSPAGIPLGASASERKFKAIMLDIGLMQHLCGINISEEIHKTDLLNIYNGALVEQFVGQELLALTENEVYYWSRDAKSSSAEVDYVIEKNGKILPIEVKSGVAGKLKSLHLLLERYKNISTGLVLSSRPYFELPEQKLIFSPIYGLNNLIDNL
ncbi:MAG: AAA family ATPase [Bacteroidota bacterium]|nr:AAA family ATPase [Bacteroidota bacterium]